jgi:hypothetical protein
MAYVTVGTFSTFLTTLYSYTLLCAHILLSSNKSSSAYYNRPLFRNCTTWLRNLLSVGDSVPLSQFRNVDNQNVERHLVLQQNYYISLDSKSLDCIRLTPAPSSVKLPVPNLLKKLLIFWGTCSQEPDESSPANFWAADRGGDSRNGR